MKRILSIVTRASLTVALAFLNIDVIQASETVPALAGLRPEDPLQVSHVVVRGVVERATAGQFDISSGEPGTSPAFFECVTVQVRVLELLRGSWSSPDITFVGLGDKAMLVRGKEYIICGLWNNAHRTFVTGPHIGIYARDAGDRWIKERMRSGRSQETDEPLVLTLAEVHSRVEEGSLNTVTRQSDVIVEGKIISTQDIEYVAAYGRHGTMRHYKLKVNEVLKGNVTTGDVVFVIPRLNEYVPSWTRPFPDIDVWQEWLVFLKVGERGLHPFAGKNSLLRIDGDSLIYDSVVQYPQTHSETIRRIQSGSTRAVAPASALQVANSYFEAQWKPQVKKNPEFFSLVGVDVSGAALGAPFQEYILRGDAVSRFAASDKIDPRPFAVLERHAFPIMVGATRVGSIIVQRNRDENGHKFDSAAGEYFFFAFTFKGNAVDDFALQLRASSVPGSEIGWVQTIDGGVPAYFIVQTPTGQLFAALEGDSLVPLAEEAKRLKAARPSRPRIP